MNFWISCLILYPFILIMYAIGFYMGYRAYKNKIINKEYPIGKFTFEDFMKANRNYRQDI